MIKKCVAIFLSIGILTSPFAAIHAQVSTSTCPLITHYLKLGGDNSPVQVSRLQSFLKNSEHFDVDVNGTFDQKTEDAVKAFQKKYKDSILAPWGATRASGFVFITTLKKINALACAEPMLITARELETIITYSEKNVTKNGAVNDVAKGTLKVANTDSDDMAASAGKASILSQFGNFVRNLFR